MLNALCYRQNLTGEHFSIQLLTAVFCLSFNGQNQISFIYQTAMGTVTILRTTQAHPIHSKSKIFGLFLIFPCLAKAAFIAIKSWFDCVTLLYDINFL